MVIETKEKRLATGAKPPEAASFPWERQSGEGPAAFARFLAYRDMPATDRSQRKVSQICEISEQLIARWSKRHDWVKRAIAYDNWMLELGDRLGKHAVLSHRGALVRFGSVALTKAEASVAKLDETKLTPEEINELAKTGAEMAASGLGLSPAQGRTGGPSVVVQTQVGYGEARPSWLERSETKASEAEPEVVVQVEEKVLERRQTGGPRTVQGKDKPKLPPPRGKLKQLVLSAPVRVEDP